MMSAPLASTSRYHLPLAMLASALVLSACGGTSVRQPAVLERIEQPEVTVERDWRSGRGPATNGYKLGLTATLHRDALFTADADGRVYALNRENGDVIWRADTDLALSGGPTVEGDQVLVGSRDAELVALSRADGSELWRTTVSSEVVAPPASNGETVIVRTVDGRVAALSAGDGSQLWATKRTVPPLTLRGLSAPVIVGRIVISGLETGRLVAQRLDDGEPVWTQAVSVPSGRSELERIADIDAPLLVEGSTLYAMSYGGDVAALDVYSGDVRWRRAIRTYSGGAVSEDGERLYVTDEEGSVWALETSNGAAAWKSEALSWRRLSAPAVHQGFVAVADFEGYVHYLSPENGRIVGRERPLGDRVDVMPLVADSHLFLADVEGRVVALRAKAE
ncbi:outer membrane protein assembly factor BamB [Algiphilus sp.]|uniref:outer membrane protein assembly factor BamB n=2 Tax=Algiphilus sp. TaxID=1872431 RepID=UPI001CA6C352|nr:outer membrane protein assembly factor BamB [Algiphilus acroporae]MCR9091958.1 outer membrane protein assembly factor BamB [Pseudomonadota bacterium]